MRSVIFSEQGNWSSFTFSVIDNLENINIGMYSILIKYDLRRVAVQLIDLISEVQLTDLTKGRAIWPNFFINVCPLSSTLLPDMFACCCSGVPRK